MKIASYWASVFDVVRLVPPGRVTTYGAVSDYLSLGSSRMVGWALNNCHDMDDVPAHRVVNRKGELSGRYHFRPPEKMQQLLKAENVEVVNDCVKNFSELLWIPAKELEL